MDSNGTPEYALYLRKSKGRAGISRQRTVTTAHIAKLGGVIARTYVDTDATAYQKPGGARPERENFDAMLSDLRANPGLRVAAWHADRLVRNSGDTEALIAGGYLVDTPSGGTYDLSTATGRKRLRSDATDAAYEVDHAIERITAQKQEAAAAGLWLGGPVPWGWRKGSSGALELREAEAQAIREGTEAVLRGLSLQAVARLWNAAGLSRSRGKPWNAVEARRALLRGRNAGLHVHKGEVTGVRGDWPEIISEAQWRACRAILRDPTRRTTTGPERRWLGSGIYTCGVCGSGLIVTAVGGKGRPLRRVYRCSASRRHVARDAATLDAYGRLAVILRLRRADAAPALVPRPPDTTTLSTELAAVRAELDDLAEHAGKGALTVRQVAVMSQAFRERETALEARLAVAARPSPLTVFAARDPEEIWDSLDLDRKRAVLAELMTVTVHPAPKGRPAGWRPGQSYFDPATIAIEWKQ